MTDPVIHRIERACDEAQAAWDRPGVMRVGLGAKVTLSAHDVRRLLTMIERAEAAEDAERVWHYVSGENADPWCTRVYQDFTGLVGKVVRTRYYRSRHDWGDPKTTYIVWALPDSAPEYATFGEALVAAIERPTTPAPPSDTEPPTPQFARKGAT